MRCHSAQRLQDADQDFRYPRRLERRRSWRLNVSCKQQVVGSNPTAGSEVPVMPEPPRADASIVSKRSNLTLAMLSIAALLGPTWAASAAEVPGTDCRVFPANNIWNTRIDHLPVHDMSETWLASADAAN